MEIFHLKINTRKSLQARFVDGTWLCCHSFRECHGVHLLIINYEILILNNF